MKKFFLLPILVLFIGCLASNNVDNSITNGTSSEEICYTGPMDLTVNMKTVDNYETVRLSDNSDRIIFLDNVGNYTFKNNDGVTFIKVSPNRAFVEFVPGRKIELKAISCN